MSAVDSLSQTGKEASKSTRASEEEDADEARRRRKERGEAEGAGKGQKEAAAAAAPGGGGGARSERPQGASTTQPSRQSATPPSAVHGLPSTHSSSSSSSSSSHHTGESKSSKKTASYRAGADCPLDDSRVCCFSSPVRVGSRTQGDGFEEGGENKKDALRLSSSSSSSSSRADSSTAGARAYKSPGRLLVLSSREETSSSSSPPVEEIRGGVKERPDVNSSGQSTSGRGTRRASSSSSSSSSRSSPLFAEREASQAGARDRAEKKKKEDEGGAGDGGAREGRLSGVSNRRHERGKELEEGGGPGQLCVAGPSEQGRAKMRAREAWMDATVGKRREEVREEEEKEEERLTTRRNTTRGRGKGDATQLVEDEGERRRAGPGAVSGRGAGVSSSSSSSLSPPVPVSMSPPSRRQPREEERGSSSQSGALIKQTSSSAGCSTEHPPPPPRDAKSQGCGGAKQEESLRAVRGLGDLFDLTAHNLTDLVHATDDGYLAALEKNQREEGRKENEEKKEEEKKKRELDSTRGQGLGSTTNSGSSENAAVPTSLEVSSSRGEEEKSARSSPGAEVSTADSPLAGCFNRLRKTDQHGGGGGEDAVRLNAGNKEEDQTKSFPGGTATSSAGEAREAQEEKSPSASGQRERRPSSSSSFSSSSYTDLCLQSKSTQLAIYQGEAAGRSALSIRPEREADTEKKNHLHGGSSSNSSSVTANEDVKPKSATRGAGQDGDHRDEEVRLAHCTGGEARERERGKEEEGGGGGAQDAAGMVEGSGRDRGARPALTRSSAYIGRDEVMKRASVASEAVRKYEQIPAGKTVRRGQGEEEEEGGTVKSVRTVYQQMQRERSQNSRITKARPGIRKDNSLRNAEPIRVFCGTWNSEYQEFPPGAMCCASSSSSSGGSSSSSSSAAGGRPSAGVSALPAELPERLVEELLDDEDAWATGEEPPASSSFSSSFLSSRPPLFPRTAGDAQAFSPSQRACAQSPSSSSSSSASTAATRSSPGHDASTASPPSSTPLSSPASSKTNTASTSSEQYQPHPPALANLSTAASTSHMAKSGSPSSSSSKRRGQTELEGVGRGRADSAFVSSLASPSLSSPSAASPSGSLSAGVSPRFSPAQSRKTPSTAVESRLLLLSPDNNAAKTALGGERNKSRNAPNGETRGGDNCVPGAEVSGSQQSSSAQSSCTPSGAGSGVVRMVGRRNLMRASTLSLRNVKNGEQPLRDWILPGYDVYVITLQETISDNVFQTIDSYLSQENGGKRYRRVHATEDRISGLGDGAWTQFKSTSIAAWAREDLLKPRGPVEFMSSKAIPLSFFNGSKGAVSLLFRIWDQYVCVLGCHMPANSIDDRVKARMCILERLCEGYSGVPNTSMDAVFHHVLWMGDFNFRTRNISADDAIELLEKGKLKTLLEHDESFGPAGSDMRQAGFNEAEIVFPPTYKKVDGRPPVDFSDPHWPRKEYQTKFTVKWYKGGHQEDRLPSWTDRIFWWSTPELASLLRVERDRYFAAMPTRSNNFLMASDHSPVGCGFELYPLDFNFYALPSVVISGCRDGVKEK